MRSTFVVLFAALLVSGNLGAQSLEESYAKLCSNPVNAKSEACQILARSLVTKIQTQQTTLKQPAINAQPNAATRALWRKRWGIYADMIGRETLPIAGPVLPMALRLAMLETKHRMDWKIPGVELIHSIILADGTVKPANFVRWDEGRNQLATTFPDLPDVVAYTIVGPDGSLEGQELAYANTVTRTRTVPIADGATRTTQETKVGGNWVVSYEIRSVDYSTQRVALARRAIQIETEQLAEQQRAEKRAKSEHRAAMFGAVVQGVAQGFAEADTGGYAESQANLNATVADIQYAAAVERQQQAQAQQQAQTRAAEEQRQKLAANARWVAEKEQAASPPAPALSQSAARQSPNSAGSSPAQSKTSGAAMTFLMQVSVDAIINRMNGTCYSNLVTIPGPPGWPVLDHTNDRKAAALVDAYKAGFLAQCGQAGPVRSGNFSYIWNARGSESRPAEEYARQQRNIMFQVQVSP